MPKSVTEVTLAAMWESYRRAVIPPGTSPAGIKNNQFAFYGGASYVLDVLMAIGDEDVSEQTGVEVLQRLRQELEVFAAHQGARLKPGN